MLLERIKTASIFYMEELLHEVTEMFPKHTRKIASLNETGSCLPPEIKKQIILIRLVYFLFEFGLTNLEHATHKGAPHSACGYQCWNSWPRRLG